MATIALFGWPLIAMVLFSACGRVKGVIWGTLIGALFLPEKVKFDLPGLPPYDKETAIIAGLLLGIWVTRNARDVLHPAPDGDAVVRKIIYGLAYLLILSSFITTLANREALTYGEITIPGLGVRDIITMVTQSLFILVPYLVAHRFLSDTETHTQLLLAFVIAGLGYSLLVLFEARMSPQLHRWVYGFFQHGWHQHIRGGKFRPIVFQPHGLWIGIFLLTCAMAGFILLREKVRARAPAMRFALIGFWFLGVLVLSRNFGATALALVFIPVIWMFGSRVQILVAIVVMTAFLAYPALRQTKIVTLDRSLELVGRISAERQQSLSYRIDNEAEFLDRIAKKPLTGWGIWGRWRIYDPTTGEDISTSDGRWVSLLGERGWIGFLAFFGLLTAPILLLPRAARRRHVSSSTAGMAVIMAAILLYQMANNTIGPMTIILVGALAGFVQRQPREEGVPEQASKSSPAVKSSIPYTRFPGATPAPVDPGRRGTALQHRRTGLQHRTRS